ncbi:MAG: DUF423 domain-containing protein [Cyclobacteriaceae bacterium]|nr:DUF423 domain-containing protein [Cyclobacteriaceae bacterium]
MNKKTLIVLGAVAGALAVSLGAFGAHALKPILESNGRTETWDLASRYQFYHALAILLTALLADNYPRMKSAAWFFVTGIVFFCGSLYILSLTGTNWFGAITPIGGVAFIAGWLWMGWSTLKN